MDPRALAMGLAFAVIWSSSFTSARVVVAYAPPLAALSVRFFIAGLIAVALARALGQSWRLTRPQARATVILGICQNATFLGLYFLAMQTVEASLAAIIASLMPLLVALIGWAAMGTRLSALGLAGLALGTGGAILILSSRLDGGAPLWGIMLCGIAALSLAIATLTVRGATSPGTVLMSVGLQMLFASVVLIPFGLATEDLSVTWSGTLVAAFLYTCFVPGLLATLVWFLLVRRIGATEAATYHFLNPFFGVAIAWALLGEALSLRDVVGVCIVAIGIFAVQRARVPPTGK